MARLRDVIAWRDHVAEALDLGGLSLVAFAVGAALAAAHTSGLWCDPEPSGQVAAIANRFGQGLVLYTDRGHHTLPPLPFVVARALSPSGATWASESVLDLGCRWLTLVCMYLGLSRHLPRPAPALATLAAFPLLFAMPRAHLHESMGQLFAAAIALATDVHQARLARGHGGRGGRGPLIALALMTALGLLTHPPIAAGASVGAAIVLAMAGAAAGGAWGALRAVAVYAGAAASAVVACAVAMTPWASPRGLLVDVFLAAGQARPGGELIGRNLARYVIDYGPAVVAALLAAGAGWALASGGAREEAGDGPAPASRSVVRACAATVPLAAVGALWLWPPVRGAAVDTLQASAEDLVFLPATVGDGILTAGLAVAAASVGVALARRRGAAAAPSPTAFAVYAIVLLPSSALHTLSTPAFRWVHEQLRVLPPPHAGDGPLVVVGLAALIAGGLRLQELHPGGSAAALALLVAGQTALWTRLEEPLRAATACTETWPDVRFLASARVRPAAAGLLALVHRVREAAPDATRHAVLMLPDDPDVEAWFERKRPAVSSADIFTDSYWSGLVAHNLARLQANPPKVIVLGPQREWPSLPSPPTLALISGLQPLLAARYSARPPVAVSLHGDEPDEMQLFVRNDR